VLAELAVMLASCSSCRCSPSAALMASRRCSLSAQCLHWGMVELHAPSPTSTPVSSSVTMSLHSSKQQCDITLEAHVASLCFKCFRYFRGVLQVFYIDVVKADRDVAHVAMVIHVCFKCRFQMFHLFQTYVESVSSGCCKNRFGCCIYMQAFQMFSYVCCSVFIWIFAMATHVVSSFF
jgi:hypothetical protein